MRALVLALSLAACTSATAPSAPVNADVVVAAERAFAARASEAGWVPAFRAFAAPDGEIAQQSGYANAPQTLAETPDDGNRNLFWWPAFAGIAQSGDLGFTTGVVSSDEARTPRGHYFTVWRRQPDGGWRWIYDGGVGPIERPNQIAPDAAVVPSLEAGVAVPGGAPAAVAEVRALEARDDPAFAADARVYRTRAPPASGVAADPEGIVRALYRIEASEAGDLVMVLGSARWPAESGDAEGLYARVWQHRGDGWVIVYDQLILPRPAPPPSN